MPITRVWQSGFELNSLASEVTSSTSAVSISSSSPKTGVYSVSIARSGAEGFTVTPSSSLTQFRTGFHYYVPVQWANNRILTLFDASNNTLYYLKVNGSGTGIGLFNSADAQIGSFYSISPSTYFHYGLDVKKNASSGWVYLYIDGNLAASFNGNTSATAVASIKWGNQSGGVDGVAYVDDCYIDDTTGEASPTPVPDERFYYKSLNGDGAYTEFTPYTGSVHYTLLDEIPPSANDYVYATSPGLRDSYEFLNFSGSVGESVVALITIARGKKESASNVLLGLGSSLSGTVLLGAFQSLPTSYGIVNFSRMETNPFGSAWSDLDISNANLFMMSSGTYT